MGKSKDPMKRKTQTEEMSKTLEHLLKIQEESSQIESIALGKKRLSKKKLSKKRRKKKT